ncbi:tyrosine recombinase XerC [Massilia sp. W12]|uniref:tyrosine recombinase XerC n=1 Tax=Massilia sp. W12 TaxID=3126507 RepID=UPI0030D47C32
MDPHLAAYLEYLRSQRKLAALTLKHYERDLALLLQAKGDLDWSALQEHHLRKAAAQMHARGLNPRSIARTLSAWRGCLRWLAQQGVCAAAPALRAPKAAKNLPKALPVDQTGWLLEQEGKPDDPLRAACDRAMFELLYSSGLRASELCGLDWQPAQGAADAPQYRSAGWIDMDEHMAHVTGKGNKMRAAPFGGKALQALQAWLTLRPQLARQDNSRDAHALFLNQRGKRISVRVLEWRIAQFGARAGLDSHLHPHMLRHSFASHMLQSSGDLRAVQEMLGHASIASTQVYTALDFQHLARVYDAAHPRAKRKTNEQEG